MTKQATKEPTLQVSALDIMAEVLSATPQDLEPHKSLRDDLQIGPLQFSEIFDALATQLGVHFTREEIERLETVQEVLDAVEDKRFDM